jgi:heat shock protein HslJ
MNVPATFAQSKLPEGMSAWPLGLVLAAAAMVAACTPWATSPISETPSSSSVVTISDDGTYLRLIDPLGGQWGVERVGSDDFTRYQAWVNFGAGGFLNHSAGCGRGYPAFYRLDGEKLAITRLEPIKTGKCSGATPGAIAASVASERRLAAFLDNVASWSQGDDRTLVLTGKNGTQALLTRPIEPNPEIAGRWLIDSIGGRSFETERRPATLKIEQGGIGANADCNSMGTSFTIPAPGRIAITGPAISTLIGCPADDAAEDALISRAITSATAYRLQGRRLEFMGGPGMVLHRPPPPDRRLEGEYEACGNTLLGAYHEGPITLTIAGPEMRDNAGCTATYAADGPRLRLNLRGGPACANPAPPYEPGKPTGIGGSISMLAVAQPDGFGFDEEGRLILRTGRGLLTICRKGSPPPFGG